jgi:hypothetical protein
MSRIPVCWAVFYRFFQVKNNNMLEMGSKSKNSNLLKSKKNTQNTFFEINIQVLILEQEIRELKSFWPVMKIEKQDLLGI